MLVKKPLFFWLHSAVAIAGLFFSVLFSYGTIMGTDRGHPPVIIFLPLVIIAWIFFHLFLLIVKWLINRGKKSALNGDKASNSWPLSLIAFSILCGFKSIHGFAAIGSIVLTGRWHVFTKQLFSGYLLNPQLIDLLIFVFSLICLYGVLLRRNWSRLIGGAGCLLVASYYGYIVIRGILHGSKTADIIYLSLIVIGLALFGYHLLVSKRIKQFMGHE